VVLALVYNLGVGHLQKFVLEITVSTSFFCRRLIVEHVEVALLVKLESDGLLGHLHDFLVIRHVVLQLDLVPALEQLLLDRSRVLARCFVVELGDSGLLDLLLGFVTDLDPVLDFLDFLLGEVEEVLAALFLAEEEGLLLLLHVLPHLLFENLVEDVQEMGGCVH